MKSVKKRIKAALGIGLKHRIQDQEAQIAAMGALKNAFLPTALDKSVLDEKLSPDIEKKLDGVPHLIHKNDIMFLGDLKNAGNVKVAMEIYFNLGYETTKKLADLVRQSRSNPLEKVLDFGAGYGRLSRYFKKFFGAEEYYASDIKEEAVLFTSELCGFKPVYHTSVPESFRVEERFDVIFAGSVFTHLPAGIMTQWLKVLAQHLTDDGVLLFSTRPEADLRNLSGSKDFLFFPVNEDEDFKSTPNSIKDTARYGTTFFSNAYLKKEMDALGLDHVIHHRMYGGVQDIVSASKK